ncbi:metal-dependent transcriptional regulator [Kocuria sp. cx-455]|uniref:metal-dependent transcriptional regulator n=1 Tax=Kocuria sp. cx-455 TaxID=2771377 RepID=UPI0016880E7E|nr:metal-dependent transcriptional regulator [Kocuria sp. cx-455]MBD2765116.1 metal-dependent transcriptional regulator [Kocuria sp. cx-455]
MSGDLIDTTEMYLRTVLELEEEGIVPMRARIVERLEHSGPTVSQTVSRMERDGLLEVLKDRSLSLTDTGRARAIEVMRKHRLAERLLADVVGLDMAYVHEEACRWEHVMSERVERRLMALLDEPRYSPYGTPIPGMGAIGGPQVGAERFKGMNLLDAASQDRAATFIVRLLPEVIQADQDMIETLSSAGVLNGARVTVAPLESDAERVLVTVSATGHSVELDRASAKAIRVDLDQDRV